MIKQSIAMVTIGAFLSLFCSKSLAISNSYELAIDYFASDNFDAAAIELRNALKNTPMNVPARVLFGQVLLELDDPRQAVTELEKGLALGGDLNLILPTLGRAYLQLLEPQKVLTAIIPPGSDPAVDGELLLLNGDAALLLGDLNYATDSYERAHSHLPSDTRPLVGKARIALARGRQGLAMSLLDQALEAEPSSVDAWILKGMHHRDSGEKKLAREALNRALQLDPLATKALGARAALLLDLGERGDASKDIALLRDVNPHDFEGLYLQAWLLISDGERERAQLMLQEVVDALGFFTPEQRQRLPQTELLFGLVNYLSQKYAQAIEDFTTFLARFPKHDGAKRYLAFTYAATGDWDGVVTTLHPSSLSEPPSDSATLTLLAEAYRAQGNSRRAARFYENALKISPNQIQIAMALAASRFSAGEIANGISEMETLVSKRPDFKAASVELVGMYSDSGQTQKALALAQQLVDDAPEDPETHNLLGVVSMQARNYPQAKRHFDRTLALDSSNTVAHLNLARVVQRNGHAAQAVERYESVLVLEPGLEPALIELAELFVAQSRYKSAAPLLQLLTQQQPEHLRASIAQLSLRLAAGDIEQLNTDIYTLSEQRPNSAIAKLGIARVYLAMGDQDKARLALKRAAENAGFDADQLVEVSRLMLSVADLNGAFWATTKALSGNPRHLRSLS